MLSYSRRKRKRILRETGEIALALIQEHLTLQEQMGQALSFRAWDEVEFIEDERDAWQAQCEMVGTVLHELRNR